MLGHTHIDSRIAQACDEFGRTALHLVPQHLCRRRLDDMGENTLSTWADFVGELLMHGADIHRRTKWGHTPLTWLLRYADLLIDPTALVRVWIRLLHVIGIDLAKYGRVERRLWYQLKPSSLSRNSYRIRDWTFGPCIDDRTVDFVHVQRVPIYILEYAPGRWSGNDQYVTKTICWHPGQEDVREEAERWTHKRDVELESTQASQAQAAQQYHEDYVARRVEFGTTCSQDDSGAVMRLIQNTFRARVRPRSSSQPTKLLSNVPNSYHTDQAWLPGYHFCMGDGQVKFGDCVEERRCARGSHPECSANEYDYYESIKREMRVFQMRYRDMSELEALPYAAYQRLWKREYTQEPEKT